MIGFILAGFFGYLLGGFTGLTVGLLLAGVLYVWFRWLDPRYG